ncbi:MAG: SUF system Fe-S cluster assembly protein [bacterium]
MMEKINDIPKIKEKIIEVLRTCYDPEIPVNIYELGLIYDIEVDDAKNALVKMTLTSPACPVAGTLPGEVEDKIRALPETKEVTVELVWEPPWTPERMSDIARYELGMM